MLFKHSAPAEPPASKASEDVRPAKLPLPSSATAGMPAAAPAPTVPATTAPAADADTGKRLIVGEGIQLKGEITACDRLVVEGQVEVTMNATRALEIKPSGHFIGSCEVEEAEISGVYDGDLTVRGRLIVHANGRVTGNICYGELELERGGQIAGQLSVREARAQTSSQPNARRNAA